MLCELTRIVPKRSIRVAERRGMRPLRPDVLFDLPVVVVYALERSTRAS
jgi:hypothetical protein